MSKISGFSVGASWPSGGPFSFESIDFIPRLTPNRFHQFALRMHPLRLSSARQSSMPWPLRQTRSELRILFPVGEIVSSKCQASLPLTAPASDISFASKRNYATLDSNSFLFHPAPQSFVPSNCCVSTISFLQHPIWPPHNIPSRSA